jgi:hypothetical protein
MVRESEGVFLGVILLFILLG